MNDETLIELVRINPVLYDSSHPKYVNRILKHNIWTSIGHVLGEDGSLCRSRWNNIRDQFRKSLKKAAMKPHQVKKYKYCPQLEFLQQHLNDRETLDPADELPQATLKSESLEAAEDGNDTSDQEMDQEERSYDAHVNSAVLSPSISIGNMPSPYSSTQYPLKSTNYYMDDNPAHPVDAFLAGIAPTLKHLNPVSLNRAKTEIFAIVQKYELTMLTEEKDS